MTFVQARSPREAGIEKTQTLPPTQPMDEEGIEGSLGSSLAIQASALAGISHGVETQVLKNMFNSLPPSSQIIESEMLGSSTLCTRTDVISSSPTDLETQRQSLPHDESMESSTADQLMKMDLVVPDRGLDCCCKVDVSPVLCFRPGLTEIPA